MAEITKKTPDEIVAMRRAGQITGSVLHDLRAMLKPGLRPIDLDARAEELIRERGGEPAFLGYRGFPATLCISVNDAVIHGIPNNRPFEPGDIVGIDCGVRVDGLYADSAITIGIPPVSEVHERLLLVTRRALDAGIVRVQPGQLLGNIQAAIQAEIERSGFGIVRELTGHGIGRNLHEAPDIPNYGRAGTGIKLRPGMAICIEPMVTVGSPEIYTDHDNWTIRTQDGLVGAQFEHTLLINERGTEILTPLRPWPKR